jgi:hypothetical protein
MSNVIRLWDTLFADPNRFSFLNFVCAATVKTKRAICLHGDFAECMENLQKATESITDVRTLLNEANHIFERYLKLKMKDAIW